MAKAPKKTAKNQTENTVENTAAEKDNQTRQPRQVMVHAQYVKDLSFENPNAVSAHLEKTETPQVEIGVQVNGDKINDHQYEVRLHIATKANTSEKPLFLVDLTYAGIVSAPDATPEEVNPLLMIEGVAPTFPICQSDCQQHDT